MSNGRSSERRPSWRARLSALFARYGASAVFVFVALSALALGSVWAAMHLGWRPQSTFGRAGTIGAAYAIYRLTLPLRVAGALALTPLVARLVERLRRRQQPS
jgi:hypothetical protein